MDRENREIEREELRRGWRRTGWYPDLTVAEALAAGAAARPDDLLVFASSDGGSDTVTLAALHARAGELASRLAATGIAPGDVVVLQAPSDRQGTEAVVALWLLGAVLVPLATTATPDELAHVVRETGAAVVLVVPAWRGVDLATRAAGTAERVVVLGEGLPGAGGPVTPSRRGGGPSSVCCVLYTSGSTAVPKGVRHSHETLLAGLTVLPADGSSRSLVTFPAGHVASVLGLLRPLVSGGTTVVMDRWSARRAAELVEEHRVVSTAGTPFFLATLLDEADRTGRDLSSLTRFMCGAAAVPAALVARAEERGIVTWRTYGSTEHPAISSGVPDDPPEKRRTTDGRVAPGNEARLLGEDGTDVPPGEVGEVVSRGPKQFLGYQDRSLDDAAFVDTWFRTGDRGYLDPDGYLVITDRVKDIVIRGGENISAREVEEVLSGHPAVAEVAVCPAPDDLWGETVCAFVVPAGGRPPSLDELREHTAGAGLAAHKAPERLVVVDELPRTPAGKVRKQDLRALL